MIGRLSARILYVDEEWMLYVKWLGLGALEVHRAKEYRKRAAPILKVFLIEIMEALRARGFEPSPSCQVTNAVFREFAKNLYTTPHFGPNWQFLRTAGADFLVDGYLNNRGDQ